MIWCNWRYNCHTHTHQLPKNWMGKCNPRGFNGTSYSPLLWAKTPCFEGECPGGRIMKRSRNFLEFLMRFCALVVALETASEFMCQQVLSPTPATCHKLRWAKSPNANRQSLVFSERGQLSQALPRFHMERILLNYCPQQWTPIVRFESQRNERRAYEDQILSFEGGSELQWTLAIRIAAITLASDSAITMVRIRASKATSENRSCTGIFGMLRCRSLCAYTGVLQEGLWGAEKIREKNSLTRNL